MKKCTALNKYVGDDSNKRVTYRMCLKPKFSNDSNFPWNERAFGCIRTPLPPPLISYRVNVSREVTICYVFTFSVLNGDNCCL